MDDRTRTSSMETGTDPADVAATLEYELNALKGLAEAG